MKNFTFFLLLLSFAACAQTTKMTTTKKNAKDDLGSYFIISQGGGFTGMYETFLALRNGTVNRILENQDTVFYKAFKSTTADSLFQMMNAIDLSGEKNSAPGNMNFSLIIFKDGKEQGLSWADNKTPSKEVLDFYHLAFSEIKKP